MGWLVVGRVISDYEKRNDVNVMQNNTVFPTKYQDQQISKTITRTKFLKVPNTSIEVQVVGKRLNRGGGYGLEIPVIYRFYGQEKLVNRLIKKTEAVKKELECKLSKCLK